MKVYRSRILTGIKLHAYNIELDWILSFMLWKLLIKHFLQCFILHIWSIYVSVYVKIKIFMTKVRIFFQCKSLKENIPAICTMLWMW